MSTAASACGVSTPRAASENLAVISGPRVCARIVPVSAAALFAARGDLLVTRAAVGRHNAVDKVVGSYVLAAQRPPTPSILMVSGRSSFEIIQKAAMAAIPMVVAVSAPSSMAVDLAREVGITLVGFLRGRGCNVYSGSDRIRGS